MRYLLAVVLCGFLITVYARKPCAKRDAGGGNFICVCNATYCDDLDPLKKTPKGVVTVFETSRDGDRLQESQLKFGQNTVSNANVKQTITLDPNNKAQKIIGIGASMTDSTGFNIKSLPQSMQDQVIRDHFSENGLEYNILRVPIGGTDFSTHKYSLDDDHNDDFNLDHFGLTDDDHQYKIPYLKAARKVSPRKVNLVGSPWAAPAWMKNNSDIIHGGYLKGNPGGQYYKTFAKYFVKFLDAYKAEGLDYWGLTIENEPGAGNNPNYDFNCMGFNPELQRDFIKSDLGPALQQAGYGADKLKVMIFDDQRDQIYHWASTILSDKDAAKYVGGTAVHWYQDHEDNVNELHKTHDVDPSKFIMNTESSYCCNVLGSWEQSKAYSRDIIQDFNHLVAGYMGWNMLLDTKGGPRWCGGKADAPITVADNHQEYYKTAAFYTLGHFSKFIVPDSVKIGLKEDGQHRDVASTAFQRPDGGIVVVIYNESDDNVELTIKEGNNHLTHNLKPHSLQTYIYYNN